MASKRVKPSTWPDDDSSTIEKRGFTTMKDHKFRYTWKINKYSFCREKVGESFVSPQFSFMADKKLRWILRLYPSGNNSDAENHVSIFLKLLSVVVEAGIKVVHKLCILSENGKMSNVSTNPKGTIFTPKNREWGFSKFIANERLQKKRESLVPNDTLTIICDITVFNGTDSVPGADFSIPRCRMSDDVGQYFENPKFTDVDLLVGNKQFHVHKVILAARSSVFAAMFEHEMVEQQKNRVEIVDFSHEVIAELLRFIYSGKVRNLREVAKDLIAAADKYALERLKVMCGEELYASLTVENAAEVLMIADRHSSAELEKQAIDFIVQHATDVVETAGYKLMLTTPSLIDKVFRATTTKNSRSGSDSGATDAKSGGRAT